MIVKPFNSLNGLFVEQSVGSGAVRCAKDSPALLTEETKYRILVKHIPAISYIATMDGHNSTLYFSPQLEAILGFSKAEWMADRTLWFKQIHPDDRAFVLKGRACIHADGDPMPCEYRLLTRSGLVRWFIDNVAVIRDTKGSPEAIYGLLLDITEQKQLETELAEIQHQLAESRKPRFSERELEVLRLINDRRTDIEIAQELAICERTVRNCVKGICTRLGVAKRAEAVRKALQLGILEEQDITGKIIYPHPAR